MYSELSPSLRMTGVHNSGFDEIVSIDVNPSFVLVSGVFEDCAHVFQIRMKTFHTEYMRTSIV